IERSTDRGATWVTAASTGVDENYFNDQGLSAEQRVDYRVIAFNSLGESAPSTTAYTRPPAGPTHLTVVPFDAITVDLAWADNSSVEDGYQVWVDDGYGSQYPIASLDSNTTTFRYVDPYNAYWYVYFVLAVKDGGYSDPSDFAYPPPQPGASIARVRSTSRPAPNLTPSLKRTAAPRRPLGPTTPPHGPSSRAPATRPPRQTGGKP